MNAIQFWRDGEWCTVTSGSWQYCQGFADAAVQLRPGLRVRMLTADGREVEWPTP